MLNIICAVILGGLGLFFIIINAVLFWKCWIKKEKCPSRTPFLGGIFCAAAILIVVDKKYYFLAIIPMLLDWGCIPTIIEFFIVLFLDWNKYMTKKEKKRVKTIILRSCIIGFVVIFLAVCIIGWHGSLQIKSWHIFTNSRIEKLEEIYNADFPQNMKFSHYNAVWKFVPIFDTLSIDHTLYIKDVADPEKFCLENFNESTEIMYMADLKNSRILKNDCYSEWYGETIANNSDKNEKWNIGERHVDFFCHAFCSEPKSEHDSLAYEIYFSQNDNGGYDVKIFMETLG